MSARIGLSPVSLLSIETHSISGYADCKSSGNTQELTVRGDVLLLQGGDIG